MLGMLRISLSRLLSGFVVLLSLYFSSIVHAVDATVVIVDARMTCAVARDINCNNERKDKVKKQLAALLDANKNNESFFVFLKGMAKNTELFLGEDGERIGTAKLIKHWELKVKECLKKDMCLSGYYEFSNDGASLGFLFKRLDTEGISETAIWKEIRHGFNNSDKPYLYSMSKPLSAVDRCRLDYPLNFDGEGKFVKLPKVCNGSEVRLLLPARNIIGHTIEQLNRNLINSGQKSIKDFDVIVIGSMDMDHLGFNPKSTKDRAIRNCRIKQRCTTFAEFGYFDKKQKLSCLDGYKKYRYVTVNGKDKCEENGGKKTNSGQYRNNGLLTGYIQNYTPYIYDYGVKSFVTPRSIKLPLSAGAITSEVRMARWRFESVTKYDDFKVYLKVPEQSDIHNPTALQTFELSVSHSMYQAGFIDIDLGEHSLEIACTKQNSKVICPITEGNFKFLQDNNVENGSYPATYKTKLISSKLNDALDQTLEPLEKKIDLLTLTGLDTNQYDNLNTTLKKLKFMPLADEKATGDRQLLLVTEDDIFSKKICHISKANKLEQCDFEKIIPATSYQLIDSGSNNIIAKVENKTIQWRCYKDMECQTNDISAVKSYPNLGYVGDFDSPFLEGKHHVICFDGDEAEYEDFYGRAVKGIYEIKAKTPNGCVNKDVLAKLNIKLDKAAIDAKQSEVNFWRLLGLIIVSILALFGIRYIRYKSLVDKNKAEFQNDIKMLNETPTIKFERVQESSHE